MISAGQQKIEALCLPDNYCLLRNLGDERVFFRFHPSLIRFHKNNKTHSTLRAHAPRGGEGGWGGGARSAFFLFPNATEKTKTKLLSALPKPYIMGHLLIGGPRWHLALFLANALFPGTRSGIVPGPLRFRTPVDAFHALNELQDKQNTDDAHRRNNPPLPPLFLSFLSPPPPLAPLPPLSHTPPSPSSCPSPLPLNKNKKPFTYVTHTPTH